MMYHILKKVKYFWVISGASGKGIAKKQNGYKVFVMSREMINTFKK